jgi:cell division transport system permease protein
LERVVDQNVHDLFERALAAEPVPPPGDLAQEAMAHGTRLRRRRRLAGGGAAACVLAVVATIVALNLAAPGDEHLPVVAAGAPVQSTCSAPPRPANEVAIFLRDDITGPQRSDLNDALRADPLVLSVQFESREQAYEKFKVLWRDSPDFAKSVQPAQLPESFRVTLKAASSYPAFLPGIEHMAGIQDIAGGACPRPSASREGK